MLLLMLFLVGSVGKKKASTGGIAQDYREVPLALAGGGAFAQRAELIGTCN